MKCVAFVLVVLLVFDACEAQQQDGEDAECTEGDCLTTPAPTTTTTIPSGTDDGVSQEEPLGDDDYHHHPVRRQALLRPVQRGEVAFSVTNGVETSRQPGIRFETVLTNVGGAWHERTSHFEAPFTGGYFFTFHAVSTVIDDFTLALMRNRRYQVTAYGSPGRQQASNSAFLTLNKGDVIHLELQEGHLYKLSDDEAYISFTGFMLYRNTV